MWLHIVRMWLRGMTLSLCQFSYNSLYTRRNGIMLLQCMLDLSLHVSLKQGAPQWQMSCTLYCVITLYNLNPPANVRGRRQTIWLAVTTWWHCTCNLHYNNNVMGPIRPTLLTSVDNMHVGHGKVYKYGCRCNVIQPPIIHQFCPIIPQSRRQWP